MWDLVLLRRKSPTYKNANLYLFLTLNRSLVGCCQALCFRLDITPLNPPLIMWDLVLLRRKSPTYKERLSFCYCSYFFVALNGIKWHSLTLFA